MLYEGGTRVAALANWPGRIKPGDVADAMHDMWPTISEGRSSPRQEIVYNIEPFRAGLRVGDWKLIWRTPLPSAIELYNIREDPSEKSNLADGNPQKVAELQRRIEELARESAKSLFLVDAFASVKHGSHGPPVLATEDAYFAQGD
jgi:arylsulfatase A-like enzyme